MLNLSLSHTLIIILITIAISLLAFNQSKIMNRLIFWPPAIQRGEYDRFFAHGFIHADGMHLLFNMITLFFFGRHVENFYRPFLFEMGYILFYLGAIIVAIIPSYLKHKNDSRWASLGASGAVSAVLFTFILFEPWHIILVYFIPVPAIIFGVLYVGYSIWSSRNRRDNINHSAHLWGAAYGIIISLAIQPSLFGNFLYKLTHL
jgi:membrane associated rhomboid family serine protease